MARYASDSPFHIGPPLPDVGGQLISQTHPGQAVLDPYMVSGSNPFGLIETANRHVYFRRVRGSQESQSGAASGAERAQPPGPGHLPRLASSETKATA